MRLKLLWAELCSAVRLATKKFHLPAVRRGGRGGGLGGRGHVGNGNGRFLELDPGLGPWPTLPRIYQPASPAPSIYHNFSS